MKEWHLLVPFLGFFAAAVVQLTAFRSGIFHLFPSLMVGFVAGTACTVLLALYPFQQGAGEAMVDATIHGCFYYTYFHFVNMGESARRIRLLRELFDHPEGLTLEEIEQKYDYNEIVLIRLQRLQNIGQIRKSQSRFFISGRVILLVAKGLWLLRQLLRVGDPQPGKPA